MEWHDATCGKLDLATTAGLQSCMSCGSFQEGIASSPTTSISTIYAPIRQQLDIRVLRLKPGMPHDPLKCELSVVDLSTNPDFEAISYTWKDESGDESLCKMVSISGSQVAVTSNCERVLRTIRHIYTTRCVWIDSLCINQTNDEERGHQVRIMPRIYSGAMRVLIYIGESNLHSDELFAILNEKSSSSYDFVSCYETGTSILSRPYFRRLWVLQEVALARRAVLLCGNSSTPWHRFVQWVKEYHSPNPSIGFNLTTNFHLPPVLRVDHRSYTDPSLFLEILDLAITCEASREHDNVYALLGLLPNAIASGIVVDYHLAVEQLFGMTAVYAASICGWAGVLQRATTLGRSQHTLRSWIPDWSHQQRKAQRQVPYPGDRWHLYKRCLIVDTPTVIPQMQDAWLCTLKFREIQMVPDGLSTTPPFQFPGPKTDPWLYSYQLLHETPSELGKDYICLSRIGPLYALINSLITRHNISHQSTQIISISAQLSSPVYILENVRLPCFESAHGPYLRRMCLVGVLFSLMWKLLPLIAAECRMYRFSEMVMEEYLMQRQAESEDTLLLPPQFRCCNRTKIIRTMRDHIKVLPEVIPAAPSASINSAFESLSKADSDEEMVYNCLWKLVLADFHWTLTEIGTIDIK